LEAHPFGNESVTHFSVLYIFPDRLEVGLLLDFAEVPSLQLQRKEIDTNRDGTDDFGEQRAWLQRKAREFEDGLRVSLNGKPLRLHALVDPAGEVRKQLIVKAPGVAGMPTYRLLLMYSAEFPALEAEIRTLDYEDRLYPDVPGMKRILVYRTPGVSFIPPHPPFFQDGSDPFDYEQYDPLALPVERAAKVSFTFDSEGGIQGGQAPVGSEDAPLRSFLETEMVGGGLDLSYRQAKQLFTLASGPLAGGAFIMVIGLAFAWGAAHALAPGHAKTLVGAYLVSRQGKARHAVLLAVVVTLTHTVLVIVLGLVFWLCQERFPLLAGRLQVYLGIAAGILIAGMGLNLFFSGTRRRRLFAHGHPHSHHPHAPPHSQSHFHSHKHDEDQGGLADSDHHGHHQRTSGTNDDPLSFTTLVLLGLSGGMVPCPTAILILLFGIGTGLVPLALFIVGIFSVGLASTLMLTGLLAVLSRCFAPRLLTSGIISGRASGIGYSLLTRVGPALAGAVITLLGLAMTAQYAYFLWTGMILFPGFA